MKNYTTLDELTDIQLAMKIHQRLFEAGLYAFLEYANAPTGELVIRIRVRTTDLARARSEITRAAA